MLEDSRLFALLPRVPTLDSDYSGLAEKETVWGKPWFNLPWYAIINIWQAVVFAKFWVQITNYVEVVGSNPATSLFFTKTYDL